LLLIYNVDPFFSIHTPSARKALIVCKQSSLVKKCVTFVSPFANEPNITARCEFDLSPGTSISPNNGCDIGFNCLRLNQLSSYFKKHLILKSHYIALLN